MEKIMYEIFLITRDTPIHVFESSWKFATGEIVFVHGEGEKRGYLIGQITHDVDKDKGHRVRLNCQEKKMF